MIKGKTQSVGEGAIAVQTDGNVVINHNPVVSAEELHALVTKEFEAKFFKMLGMASDIATARAEAVTTKFLERVEKEHPEILKQANDPNFRNAIYVTRKVAALAGDEQLENLLVELLLQRGKQSQRSLIQIVLNESIEAAGLLTDGQIASLTLIFFVRATTNFGIVTFKDFVDNFVAQLRIYIDIAEFSPGAFSHLTHARCGSVSMGAMTLAHLFSAVYPGLWQIGVASNDPMVVNLQPYARALLVPHEASPELLKINAATETQIKIYFKERNISSKDQAVLLNLFNSKVNEQAIKDACIKAHPDFVKFFKIWDESEMKNFIISNIGMAIAHANVSRIVNFSPLSNWIK